jgi:hypothetical protein
MQVQDSRVLGSEGISAASTQDVLEMHQGYLDITRHVRQRQFDVRAGRQEISIGNERLVGVSNWTNLGRSFDGIRLTLSSDTIAKNVRWTVNAMAATVEERGRHFGANSTDEHPTDHRVAGLFATRELPHGTILESTLLYDGSGKYRRYSNADRGTVYGRVRSTLPLGLRADIEGALQFGHQQYTVTDSSPATSQDVRAWLLGARLATPAIASHKFTVGIGADLLSGDDTPTDGRYSTFSTMYASNHSFYGLEDVVNDPAASTRERGLVDLLATSSLNLASAVSVRAEAHQFTMATGTNRGIGSEFDLLLPIKVGSAASVELGYTTFIAERGAASIGLGAEHSTRQWAYLQLRAGF